jgi:hypothetical protein
MRLDVAGVGERVVIEGERAPFEPGPVIGVICSASYPSLPRLGSFYARRNRRLFEAKIARQCGYDRKKFRQTLAAVLPNRDREGVAH